MKNRLLSLLLTLSLLLSLMPTAVFAADASTLTVVINDVHVVQDGRAVAAMPSGVRYSEATNTLTLDDADLGMLRIYGGSLTIALEGDSTVHNDGSYVYRGGDHAGEPVPAVNIGDMAERLTVTITGPGSLTADTSGSGARRTFLADDTDLTITDGARVTVRSSDAGGGVAEMVSSRLILNGGAGLTGKELFVSEDGTLLVDGASLEMDGDADYALHLREGGQATILDGTVSLFGTADTHVPVRCEADCVLALLGGTVLLEQESAGPLMTADGTASVLIGDGMTAVDNTTGNTIPVDDAFRRQISGTSVTISGERSLGMYACELSIPSGQVTQGVRFNVRAVVTLGAETGEVSFNLPAGVSYVPGSLTVDSRSVDPAATSPLTVELARYGVIRFSAVASRTGVQTLTASTAAGGQTHRESLDFAVADFDLSLPSRTTRLEIPVTGTAAPGSAIAFYEGEQLLGRAEANSLGTWAGTVVLPDVEGEHAVYAAVTPAAGSGFRSSEQIITYDPDADEVTTLTVTNYVHGRTSADPPVEETLVIDYLTGADSADYYTFWPDLPTFSFQVEFLKDASAQGSVTVVTTDRMGRETRVPLRYQAARDAWVGSADYTEDTAPCQFRVEYVSGGTGESTAVYTYDENGNLAKVEFPDATSVSLSYEEDGQVGLTTSGMDFYHNGTDITLAATGAMDDIAELEWDEDNRIQKISYTDGGSVTFAYEYAGQLSSGSFGNGLSEIISDDGKGNVVSFRAASAEGESYQMELTLADGNHASYTYDAFGNFTSVTDNGGNTTEYARDEQGNLLAIHYPDGKSETFTYDAAGRATSHTSRSGETTTYSYDGNGNLTRKAHSSGETVSYTYDGAGNLTSVNENGQTTSMTYDGNGNLTKVTYPDGRSIAYAYDSENRRTLLSDSDGYQTGYTYNGQGLLSAVTDGTRTLIEYSYDGSGNLIQQKNANGTYTLYTYAGENLSSIRNYDAAGSLISSFSYSYNSDHLVSAMTDDSGTWRYSYDESGQLISTEAPDGTVTSYVYDAAGNRLQVTAHGETTRYSVNGMNQYTGYGNVTRAYDGDGNLLQETKDGQTARYTWDAWGQLVGYTDFDGTVYEYGYDAFGLRNRVTVDGVTTTYLNDPTGYGYAVASYSEGQEAHYVVAGTIAALQTEEATYYYHSDRLGSVTEITNVAGETVNRYTYDQEGSVLTRTEGISNPYTYAGVFGIVADGNGLIYDRARYVSAETDSFISMDPAGQTYDLNLYRYVYNDPINNIDTSGKYGLKININIGGLNINLNNQNQGQNSNQNPKPPITNTKDPNDNNQKPGSGGGGKWESKDHVNSGETIDYPACVAAAGIAAAGLVLWKLAAWTPPLGPLAAVKVGAFAVGGILLLPILFPQASPPALAAEPASTPDRAKQIIWDPSGFVYEGIESNRLSGVTTTLYYSAGSAKPSGHASESQRWDAADFGQQNPLTTDALGQYLWMVPDGWWQVKYEKTGYETAWSDWLPVPPVQTEVNVGLVSRAAAELTLSGEPGEAAVLLCFDRPVQISTVTAETVRVARSGAALAGTLTPLDPGVAADGQLCATTFRLDGGQTLRAGDILSASYDGVMTYAGTESTGSTAAEPLKAAMPFTDVAEGAYYYDSVLWAVGHTPQITAGTSATTFSPSASCTRAQAVTFLWRAMGQPEPVSSENPFTDVQTGAYYYKAVLWAMENGITSGTSASTFSPNDPCTRGQIVTFLHRVEKEQAPATTDNPFRDVAADAYYCDAVLWAAEWGITSGTSANTFSPNDPCTRGQIVTFLYRDMA